LDADAVVVVFQHDERVIGLGQHVERPEARDVVAALAGGHEAGLLALGPGLQAVAREVARGGHELADAMLLVDGLEGLSFGQLAPPLLGSGPTLTPARRAAAYNRPTLKQVQQRVRMASLAPEEAVKTFDENVLGFTSAEAQAEASRGAGVDFTAAREVCP